MYICHKSGLSNLSTCSYMYLEVTYMYYQTEKLRHLNEWCVIKEAQIEHLSVTKCLRDTCTGSQLSTWRALMTDT